MKKNDLQKRLEKIVNLEEHIREIFNLIPVDIPNDITKKVINSLLETEEIKELVDAIENPRPPRLVLVGRTGVGKSSLINAISSKYLAEVSDVEVGTKQSKKHVYKSDGETVIEVIDTRGIGESEKSQELTAEQYLKKTVQEFAPDAVLFLSKAKERGHIDKDIEQLKEIKNNLDVPVIAINSQVDELEPSRFKDPQRYTDVKIENIEESEKQLKRYLNNKGIKPFKVLSVSSYIEWAIKENEELKHVDPKDLEANKLDKVKIQFDGRYNIDLLSKLLLENIDLNASMKFAYLRGVEEEFDIIIKNIIKRVIKSFSVAAGIVGTTPIPTSDIYVLTPIQVAMIMIIGYLNGRDLGYENAKEILGAIGGNLLAATLLQQGAKLLNIVFPGAGSAISGSIAAGGTYGIGKAAEAYFSNDISEDKLEEIAKNEAKKAKKKYENKF